MVARDGAPRRSARSVHTEIKNAKLSKDARRLHMLKKGLRKAQRGDPFFEDGRPDGNTAQVRRGLGLVQSHGLCLCLRSTRSQRQPIEYSCIDDQLSIAA